jgi:hypothetical protein
MNYHDGALMWTFPRNLHTATNTVASARLVAAPWHTSQDFQTPEYP